MSSRTSRACIYLAYNNNGVYMCWCLMGQGVEWSLSVRQTCRVEVTDKRNTLQNSTHFSKRNVLCTNETRGVG
jgi:hypothetical protein